MFVAKALESALASGLESAQYFSVLGKLECKPKGSNDLSSIWSYIAKCVLRTRGDTDKNEKGKQVREGKFVENIFFTHVPSLVTGIEFK